MGVIEWVEYMVIEEDYMYFQVRNILLSDAGFSKGDIKKGVAYCNRKG